MSALHIRPALITGSSRGIGRAIALQFANAGYPVIINGYHHSDKLMALKQQIEDTCHVPCMAFAGDLSQYSVVEELFELIEDAFGTLAVLVNNIGISHVGLLSHMKISDWDRLIQTNISSYFYCSKLAIPYMLAQQGGSIINISSVWGNVGASCEAAYAATKGAVNAMTRSLGKELAPSGISVNAIACGVIDTEMNHFLDDEERRALMEEIPAGRFSTPEEVASLTLQLAETNSYLTGQVISFDGGWI